jgi:Ankyrin repeats (3 copies)
MKFLLALAAALALAQAPPLTKAEQLQEAARKGDAATVKKLLDEGVDVNTKFRYNATALFYACDHGHLEVVKVLLDHGADMSIKDTFYGFTPLALATGPAQKKKPEHTEIAKLLIQKGSPGKDQALSGAVQSGDAALTKVILDSGGLPAAALSEALETAKAANKPDMVTLLESAGAKPFEDFKIDPALLAKFPGTYKSTGGNELTVVAAGARITLGQAAAPAAQRLTLVATGDKAFKAIGAPITVTFQVEGDKVASFTLTQGSNPGAVFTRVEGK